MQKPSYPEQITIGGRAYRVDRVLHDDFFSINVLYVEPGGGRQILKLSDFRMIGGFLFRPMAAWMSRREYRIYGKLEGVVGVPTLGPRCGDRGYFHDFVPGKPLDRLAPDETVPDDFFDRLVDTYKEMHLRGIAHVDSNKRSNLILGNDGRPYVIDFQVALDRGNGRTLRRRRESLFLALARSDIYHVYKLKARLRPDLMRPEEWALADRPRQNRIYDRIFGGPYRTLKRMIYRSGSTQPRWRRSGNGRDTDA
ncbi:MAG: hypothetical protein GY791_06870 [Alphaproteobacteria bacterium]|nr:hypothetical protein [Alphaproteobacteria bacterium]